LPPENPHPLPHRKGTDDDITGVEGGFQIDRELATLGNRIENLIEMIGVSKEIKNARRGLGDSPGWVKTEEAGSSLQTELDRGKPLVLPM
jgi:hypothetical protein